MVIIENLMHFLHVAPLTLILLLVLSATSYKLLFKKAIISAELFSVALLLLCSIGIIAGHYVHHHEGIGLLDPCFGYGLTLIGVALRIAKAKSNSNINARE